MISSADADSISRNMYQSDSDESYGSYDDEDYGDYDDEYGEEDEAE